MSKTTPATNGSKRLAWILVSLFGGAAMSGGVAMAASHIAQGHRIVANETKIEALEQADALQRAALARIDAKLDRLLER